MSFARVGHRPIAMLYAYFDASNTKQAGSLRIGSIAGYVAPLEEWARVEQEWVEALDLWGLETFHYAELPSTIGIGHGKAENCAGYFANIIKRSSVHAIGAALDEDDWHEPAWGSIKTKRYKTPYEQMLSMALQVLAKHVRQEFPGERVQVYCDRDASEEAIVAVFEEAKIASPQQLATVAVGDRHKYRLLQCADLAAGMQRKSWLRFFSPDSDAYWGDFPRPKNGRARFAFWSLKPGIVIAEAVRRSSKNPAS